jgi:hypothetical protein
VSLDAAVDAATSEVVVVDIGAGRSVIRAVARPVVRPTPAAPSAKGPTTAGATGGGGSCKKCADLLNDQTTQLGDLCPASQSIAQALGMCACGSCSSACADIFGGTGMQPSPTCIGCMQTSCAAQYQSCNSDV